MYRITAIRKELNITSDGIMINSDSALREIVTGLIHEGYTVTVEPNIYFEGGKYVKSHISDNGPANAGMTMSTNVRG